MNKEKLDRLQGVLDEMVETSFVAGVNCLVLEHGKEVGYYEAGYRDLKSRKSLSRDTIFLLYSMTKPITAAVTMLLMEEGRVDLLDPVSKYISGFRNQKVIQDGKMVPTYKEVTIKDLLSMTSGIVYGGIETLVEEEMGKVFERINEKLLGEAAYTTLQVAEQIGRCPLKFQPGTKWQYGASADVLGAVVECVSGMKFGEFLKQRIFEPLEMKDTAFYVPEEKKERLSKVYQVVEGELVEYRGNHLGIMTDMPKYPKFESGGAGLVSTIDDYARFATMLMNKGTYNGRRILAPKTVEYMTSCHLDEKVKTYYNWDSLAGYSYGNLMRVMIDSGLAVINGTNGEYGWDGWLGPYFMNDPVHKLTILMMQQRTDSGTTAYTRKIRNIVAGALE